MAKIALSCTLLLLVLLTACKDETAPAPTPPKAAMQAAQNAAAAADANNGRKVYESFCASCHATGALHAPKLGDREAWADRIAEGIPDLVEDAINGTGDMPPKGGNMQLSDAEVKAAVEYMVENSR